VHIFDAAILMPSTSINQSQMKIEQSTFISNFSLSGLIDNNYVRIIACTISVYFFLILAIRLFGKKELAQLSVFDLVFILLISNVVQNAMTGPDTSLSGGLVGAASLFIVNYILKYLEFRFPIFGKAVQGEALILIFKGKVNDNNLRNAKISTEEMMETIREHGVTTIAEVDLAVLEVDGNISVLSNQYNRKTSHRRKAHKIISKEQ
jgi:uncharacterized membrane protein YcaP (DUF421 family)